MEGDSADPDVSESRWGPGSRTPSPAAPAEPGLAQPRSLTS